MEDFIAKLSPAVAKFCEGPVEGLPRYPANTYSNLAPILAGVVILYLARHQSRGLRMLGWATVYTGVASGIFHATDTFVGEILDLSGMYLFILTCLGLQLRRFHKLPRGRVVLFAIGSCVLCTAFSVWQIYLATPIFAVVVTAVILLELTSTAITYRYAYYCVFWLLAALAFWLLDFFHIWCDPDNHLVNGHSLWHLLSGLVLFFAYLHFAANSPQQAAAQTPATA